MGRYCVPMANAQGRGYRVRCLIARGDAERALQSLVSAATLITKTGAEYSPR